MGKIVFVCDAQDGHFISTFGLADSLKERGHDVYFLSIVDNEKAIREQGFEFYPIMEDIYPLGFKPKFKKISLLPEGEKIKESMRIGRLHVLNVVKDAYDPFFNKVKGDVFVICHYLPFDILILFYKYNVQLVILNPVLWTFEQSLMNLSKNMLLALTTEEQFHLVNLLDEKGIKFNSFEELFTPIAQLPQLVVCPAELEIGKSRAPKNVHYIEPSLRRMTLTMDVYKTYQIPEHKKIVYASMGSQSIRHGVACDLFFGKAIEALSYPELKDLHLILSVGNDYDKRKLGKIPENVTVLGWGPQLDLLKVASVAIMHDGLGGVKESIYFGVPMIILPQGYDQPLNADRIVHHKLGFADNFETVTAEDIKYYILTAISDPEIQASVKRMQKIFQEKEVQKPGVEIIENLLKQTRDQSPEKHLQLNQP